MNNLAKCIHNPTAHHRHFRPLGMDEQLIQPLPFNHLQASRQHQQILTTRHVRSGIDQFGRVTDGSYLQHP
ncbi:hypothetical protein D3C81_1675390 [compost metagenome]